VHLSSFSTSRLSGCLKHQGISLRIGPFVVRVRSSIGKVSSALSLLYSGYIVVSDDVFCDFHIRLDSPSGLRSLYKPQVRFYFDEKEPFKPLPIAHAFPLFEWGLNWCIAKYAHNYLIFHSAVLEKNGKGLILPGSPGAGKSTLCAALMLSGWRLLSDEMAMVNPATMKVRPIPRPVALKNESIDIISSFNKDAVIGSKSYDTSKGTVAHLKVSHESILKADDEVNVDLVILPDYKSGTSTKLKTIPEYEMLRELINNSFNYNILRESAFDTTCQIVEQSDCFSLEYSDLHDVIKCLDRLVSN